MNIPNKVKIGGITYDVTFTNEVDKFNRDVDGQIIYDKQEITLKGGMKREYNEEVFLHEILHGIFDFLNYRSDTLEFRCKNKRCNKLLAKIYVKNDEGVFVEDKKIIREGAQPICNGDVKLEIKCRGAECGKAMNEIII